MDIDSVSAPTYNQQRYLWLKSLLPLDLLDLDTEVSRIQMLVQDAAENAAESNEAADSAKSHRDYMWARVAADLRTNVPAGVKPPSEAQIESQVPLDSRYQEALMLYSSAKRDAALWQTVVDGLRTKSSSIRAAADLIVAGYLTTNHVQAKRRESTTSGMPAPRVPVSVRS